MTKPYIVFITASEHGLGSLVPVFEIFENNTDTDTTLYLRDKNIRGLGGTDFSIDPIKVNRKPNALMTFEHWFGLERLVGNNARSRDIPVVMFDHGMPFCFKDFGYTYRKTIQPATVGCLWSKFHMDIMCRLNGKDNFVVTGNPQYDQMVGYVPPEMDVPSEFALLLTDRWHRDCQHLNPSAEALSEIMPVVVKRHPRDVEGFGVEETISVKKYYTERYQTYTDYETLLPLIYKAKIIISNMSSALVPAMLWRKPIFILDFEDSGYKFNDFRDKYCDVFNFKQDAVWNDEIIRNAKILTAEDAELFGHKLDGKNAERVAKVIMDYAK